MSKTEVLICSAVRMPIGAFQGSLADVAATRLGATAVKAAGKELDGKVLINATTTGGPYSVIAAGVSAPPRFQVIHVRSRKHRAAKPPRCRWYPRGRLRQQKYSGPERARRWVRRW